MGSCRGRTPDLAPRLAARWVLARQATVIPIPSVPTDSVPSDIQKNGRLNTAGLWMPARRVASRMPNAG